MFRLLALSAGVVVAMAVTAHGQTTATSSPTPIKRPDFSGTWVFASAEDGTGRQGGQRGAVGLGREFNVIQHDKTMALTAIALTEDEARLGRWKTTLSLDSTAGQDLGSGETAKIGWDGSKLVLTVGNSYTTRKQVWALDATGSVLTVETVQLNPPPTADGAVKVVYNKK